MTVLIAPPGTPATAVAGPARPVRRPRRLRRTAAMRELVAENRLTPAELVLPMFVRDGIGAPVPIPSMPGVVQHTRDSLRRAAADAVRAGVGGIMVFGVPDPADKDDVGRAAVDERGVLNACLADLARDLGGSTVLCGDLCIDEFTTHGHCGVLAHDGTVDNDRTLAVYAEMAVAMAEAGADMVCPSGMMDHQVHEVRTALDAAGHSGVAVLAYSAKYASAFYGPFRDAVSCTLDGDRTSYQMDPRNGRESLVESLLDVAEGADAVMVKPAGYYLDVVRRVREAVDIPVAAYQVSGEFAMIENAAARGLVRREQAVLESLFAIRRAGASFVLTYWAAEAAAWIRPRTSPPRSS